MLRLIPLMFCMLVCFAFRARADEAFEMESIVLLNPMSEFGKRAPATKTTSAYINAIKAKVVRSFRKPMRMTKRRAMGSSLSPCAPMDQASIGSMLMASFSQNVASNLQHR